MRNPLLTKIAVVVTTVVVTHLVTNRIIAQYPSRLTAKYPTGLNASAPLISSMTTATNLPMPADAILVHGNVSAQLGPRQFEVAGGQIRVQAEVDLIDPGRGGVYVWKLKAVRVEDRVKVLDMPYLQQAFKIDPSGQMKANFSEQFRLPPGQYRVTIAMLYLPTWFNPEDLNDETKLETIEVVSAQETVSTP